MVEITKCIERGKNGKSFCIVHFFDVDDGSAGNCLVSPSYLEKLTRGVAEGKTLKIGYKDGKNFLYLK